MKSLIALLILAVLIGFSACGRDKTPTSSTEEIDGTYANIDQKKHGGTVLYLVTIDDGLAKAFEIDIKKKTYSKFEMALNLEGKTLTSRFVSHSCMGEANEGSPDETSIGPGVAIADEKSL